MKEIDKKNIKTLERWKDDGEEMKNDFYYHLWLRTEEKNVKKVWNLKKILFGENMEDFFAHLS